jgi:hypothetical protein
MVRSWPLERPRTAAISSPWIQEARPGDDISHTPTPRPPKSRPSKYRGSPILIPRRDGRARVHL